MTEGAVLGIDGSRVADLCDDEIIRLIFTQADRAPDALRWLAVGLGPLEPRQVDRYELCPCGSGKKFKKCCLDRIAGHA